MPDRTRPGLTTPALTIGNLQDGSGKLATGKTNFEKTTKKQQKTIKTLDRITTVGTWNVRTLQPCGKVEELEHELKRYRWNVIGLAEVRWKGNGEKTTDSGNVIWYSGLTDKRQQGVGFIVNKEIVNTVIKVDHISSRIISIRLAAVPMNITIIQVYAPTSDYDDDIIEEFYEQIEIVIATISNKDFLIIQGDWNAKVGGDCNESWTNTAGRFGLGETNHRGYRLLEFAEKHKLVLSNTLHPQKESRKATWHSPDGKSHNQIDYILTPQRFKSSINKASTRTYPGAVIYSDHDLVLCNLQLKLKRKQHTNSKRIKLNTDKLLNEKMKSTYQEEIGIKLENIDIQSQTTSSSYDEIAKVLKNAGEKVLGKVRYKKQSWMTDDILDRCDERRKLKSRKNSSPEKGQEYRTFNSKLRRIMRETKAEWIEKQCSSIDQDIRNGIQSKRGYETLKTLTNSNREKKKKQNVIENKKSKLLTEELEVRKRWTEYCKDLYNYPIKPDTNRLVSRDADSGENLPILRSEVENALKCLKKGKAPGIDNIPGELLINGGTQLVDILTKLCQKVWEEKEWPDSWTQSLIIPIPKKGNLKKCENYRTISLISHASKILLRIILNRLNPMVESILAEEQAGFRKKRSTTEQILNCRIMSEKYIEHGKILCHNFIDFKKAFDRVWHKGLWNILRNYNIDENLILIIESLYNKANSAVLINNEIGDFFKTTVGVRQGCLLSPTLFNIFLEKIMQETLKDHNSSISVGGYNICNLRFADDIDLMAGSITELQKLTDNLQKCSSAYGMEVSSEKSKVLINEHTVGVYDRITMNGEKLETVEKFKYLGSTMTKNGKSDKEIKIRMATANAAMLNLETIWKSRSITLHTKIHLYKSVILSILLYGCESWTISKNMEKRLEAFDTKAYRKILGITYRERKTNEYVKKRIGPVDSLLKIIKKRKLKHYGHTMRHNTLHKLIMQGFVDGKRRSGRPRINWMTNILEWTEKDLGNLLPLPQDRHQWREVCRIAANHIPPTINRSRDKG